MHSSYKNRIGLIISLSLMAGPICAPLAWVAIKHISDDSHAHETIILEGQSIDKLNSDLLKPTPEGRFYP